MQKTWRLQGLSETCLIAPRSSVSQDDQGAYLSAQLDRWLADPLSQRILLDLYDSLRGHSVEPARRMRGMELQRYVKTALLEAFKRGELVLMRMPHQTVFPTITMPARAAAAAGTPPAPVVDRPQSSAGKTWVEIELVDQDGEPVPDARYLLELADGSTRTGKLDGSGRAQVRDIDPGTARVTFPDFDGSEWDTAG
jgi:hypothetical protein